MVSEPIEVRDDGDASFTIIGTTRPGEKLEIVQDSNDPDGNGELSYQWQLSLDHGLSWNNISSDPTYQLHEANRSGLLRSLVSYRDEEGFDEAIYTNTLDLSQSINLGSGTFEISGQPYIGNTLEAFQSHYDPWRWKWPLYMADFSDKSKWSFLKRSPNYKIGESDLDKYLRVNALYLDQGGNLESIFTNPVIVSQRTNNGSAEFALRGVLKLGNY